MYIAKNNFSMDIFRTLLEIPSYSEKINYQSHCFFIGSCFTESIGNYLKDLKFSAEVNPFGIVYNPSSIKNSIDLLIKGRKFTEKDLDFYNDVWFSFQHHSRFSDSDKKRCLRKINEALETSISFLKRSDFLFITLGTAFTYFHKEKKYVVANCHKFPSATFTKKMLTPDEIFSCYSKMIHDLKKINPSLKIIFTISPVRHINDGITENQHSKSVLFVAVHKIIGKFNNCTYFPAYEIMMDELRDYRFYASDMIHPGEAAIHYIRKRFTETFIERTSREIMTEIEKLIAAKNHRIFFPETNANKKFLKKNLQKIAELKRTFPFLDLKEFEGYFRK